MKNRIKELHEHLPLAARQFDRMINSVASWANCYTVKMEIDLTKDLLRLKDKWESKQESDRLGLESGKV